MLIPLLPNHLRLALVCHPTLSACAPCSWGNPSIPRTAPNTSLALACEESFALHSQGRKGTGECECSVASCFPPWLAAESPKFSDGGNAGGAERFDELLFVIRVEVML